MPSPTDAPSAQDRSSRPGAGGGDPWIDSEPHLWGVLPGVVRRGARRLPVVVLVAAAATALAAASRNLRPPVYEGSVTFRIEEGALQDRTSAPRPPSRIREYIATVVLSRERVLALMERHGISARLRQVNPVLAVEGFRDDLQVEVMQNGFLVDWGPAAEPRTAQVVVSLRGDDREQVQVVVQEVADLVLEAQATSRAARMTGARQAAVEQAQRARDELVLAQARRTRLLLQAGDGAPARLRADLEGAEHELQRVAGRVRQLERRASQLEFAAALEESHLGLMLTPVDQDVIAIREPLRGLELARFAAAGFAAFAVASLVTAGAFSTTVHGARDVLDFGLPLLGAVPPFPGDRAGALRTRRAGGR